VGLTILSATDGYSGVSGMTSLTVTGAVLELIQVTPSNPSIAAGTNTQFTATGIFDDGTTQDLSSIVSWTSSDNTIATVIAGGLAYSKVPGTTSIVATDAYSGLSGLTGLTVTNATLQALSVSPSDATIPLGNRQQFNATGTFSDASTQDLTSEVVWGSDDWSIAIVDLFGLAYSNSMGTTTITATHPGSDVSGSATLTVTAVELISITVTPANPSLALGTSQQFSATGTYSDTTTQDLTDAVTWSSSNESMATISNASGSKGLAGSVAVGSTTISATDPASGISGSTTLTVTDAVLVSIDVTPTNASLPAGFTQQFTATGAYTDGSTQDITVNVTWESADTAVATISNAGDSKGLATGVAAGTVSITAIDPATNTRGSTTLEVASLDSIAITPANPSLRVGESVQLDAIGFYSNGSSRDVTEMATWSSSGPDVATVSNTVGSRGLVTAQNLSALLWIPSMFTASAGAGFVIVGLLLPTWLRRRDTKLLLYLALLVLLVVSFASCRNDDDGPPGQNPQSTTITAGIGDMAGSTTVTVQP
jgi:uncharacterized protein YjdB